MLHFSGKLVLTRVSWD